MPVTYTGHYKVIDGNGGKRGNFGDIASAMTAVSEFAPNAAIKETVFENGWKRENLFDGAEGMCPNRVTSPHDGSTCDFKDVDSSEAYILDVETSLNAKKKREGGDFVSDEELADGLCIAKLVYTDGTTVEWKKEG